jgi:formylglycine-generating enzyme required for sulfatase activity
MSTPPIPHFLPQPFDWCHIPAGAVEIRYGCGDMTYPIEKNEIFHVPEFFMAKYPVTNAQYDVFINHADGYKNPAWWDFSDEAKLWRDENSTPETPNFTDATMPRTRVSWYDAVAFCRWISAITGNTITLPSEQQWQRAAQGDDGREYPWGNSWDAKRCNHDSSDITPVTHYEGLGDSPFGVVDMAGNVWDWTSEPFRISEDGGEELGVCIARGGSWFEDEPMWYSTYFRQELILDTWNIAGFRVCCIPPPNLS